jgi:hypothetical protein
MNILLFEIGILTVQAMLCLIVFMIVPPVLMLWTVYAVWKRGTFEESGKLIACNVWLAIALVVTALILNIGTVFQLTEAGYSIATFIFVVLVSGVYLETMRDQFSRTLQRVKTHRQSRQ